MKDKKIIVKSSGPLYALGGVTGPILTPFSADIPTIRRLLEDCKVVFEVSPDGKTMVPLTHLNVGKINFTSRPVTGVNHSKEQMIHKMQMDLAAKSSRRQRMHFSVDGGNDFRR